MGLYKVWAFCCCIIRRWRRKNNNNNKIWVDDLRYSKGMQRIGWQEAEYTKKQTLPENGKTSSTSMSCVLNICVHTHLSLFTIIVLIMSRKTCVKCHFHFYNHKFYWTCKTCVGTLSFSFLQPQILLDVQIKGSITTLQALQIPMKFASEEGLKFKEVWKFQN